MFFTLLKYELKKLFQKKSVWIVLLVGILFLPASLLASICFHRMDIDTVRGSLSENRPAVLQADIRQDKELSGRPIDGSFVSFLLDAEQPTPAGESLDRGSQEYIEYVRAYENARMYVRQLSGYNNLEYAAGENPHQTSGESLYQDRQKWMEAEWLDNCLKEEEIQYLAAVDSKNEKPFVYRYCQGWGTVMQSISMGGMILLFGAAICLPGIFTEDKRTKADRIVLSAKYGRGLSFSAKMLASVLFAEAVFLVTVLPGIVLVAVFFGLDGFNAPIQMLYPMLPLNLTIGQAALILAGLGIAEGAVLSVLCMILSETTESATPALVTLFAMLLAGNILSPDPSHRILARLWDILPTKIAQKEYAFSARLFGFSGKYFFAYQAAPVIYLALSALLCFWGYRHYKHSQVKG